MRIDKDFINSIFDQREHSTLHAPYQEELTFYKAVAQGDVKMIESISNLGHREGLGVLSENPLHNQIYHFIVTTAMITRFCIEAGMEPEESYGFSDLYIRKADTCSTPQQVLSLYRDMVLDYALRMKQLRQESVYSKHIVLCIDYIYNHLHKRLTVRDIANNIGLHENYLSKLFRQETGESLSNYIRRQRIEAAKMLLKFSEYSYSDIANYLAFSSQSHFTQVFGSQTKLTPKEYRNKYFRSNWRD